MQRIKEEESDDHEMGPWQGVTPSTARARDTDAFANFNFTDPNFFQAMPVPAATK